MEEKRQFTNPKTNRNEQENADNSIKKYKPSIKNFVRDEFSICREERQYAVFLYNILQKYRAPSSREGKVQKIFEACGLKDVVVEHVFYEVTFMRDFFERDRQLRLINEREWSEKLLHKTFSPSKDNVSPEKGFNTKLIQYVWKWGKKENEKEANEIEYSKLEYNLGQAKIGDDKLYINKKDVPDAKRKQILYRARWMMNAKPDIAVIYRTSAQNNQKCLLFLECKFESGESKYSYKDESMTQTQIQGRVADFLVKFEYLGGNVKVADCMKKETEEGIEYESKLVNFVREKKRDGEILIKDLIESNNKIFK